MSEKPEAARCATCGHEEPHLPFLNDVMGRTLLCDRTGCECEIPAPPEAAGVAEYLNDIAPLTGEIAALREEVERLKRLKYPIAHCAECLCPPSDDSEYYDSEEEYRARREASLRGQKARADAAEARVRITTDAIQWVLNDARYKAPEQIGQAGEAWIARLKAAAALESSAAKGEK